MCTATSASAAKSRFSRSARLVGVLKVVGPDDTLAA
jgi:hypothetical protein